MIKINLLPGKKPKKAEVGQRHLVYMGVTVLVVVAGLSLFHIYYSSQLDDIAQQNRLIQADIVRLKAELGDYDKVKGQRDELLKQRTTIQSLEKSRTGPVFLLREISEILTPGKGPTFDTIAYQESLIRDPNAGFNSSWDTRRVWLNGFDEGGRNVHIRGAGKSNEDVAEFLKRLNLSVFFKDVVFQNTASTGTSEVKYVTFNLAASVIY